VPTSEQPVRRTPALLFPENCCVRLANLHATLLFGFFLWASATGATAQSWNLAWSDEFNGTANSPIDTSNWQYDTGTLNVNNEAEYYCAPTSTTSPCNPSTPNAYIDGIGHLVIQAIRIDSGVAPYSGSWTSARLNTGNNLQSIQYGRIESSMVLPIGPGLWPAFWALGTNVNSVGWPASGEMDFMENVPASAGLGPSAISSTIHGGIAYNNDYGPGKQYTFPANDPNGPDVTTFHTYGAIWSTNMVQFYVDDPTNIFFVRTANDIPSGFSWDFNHPFFLLLNLAVGGTGSWPGTPDNTTPSPAIMLVDYVRLYTATPVAGPSMSAPSISVKAGQTGTSTVSLKSPAGNGRAYLSCATNATNASCSINSSDPLSQYTVDFSQSATGTATVSVTTTANTSAISGVSKSYLTTGLTPFTLAAMLVLSWAPFLLGRRLRTLSRALAALGVLLILVLLASCGGSGGSGGGGNNGTPPGNYTLTVNAYTVSNTTGDPDSTLSIFLTVN
jgi:beta-glucanase (GH16 family)